MITSRLAWQIPKNIRLFNYADDFLVMGETEFATNAAADALGEAIALLPGGHFSPHRFPTRRVEDGFEFLGHSLTMRSDGLEVTPTLTNIDRLYERLEAFEKYARQPVIKLPADYPKDINPRLNAIGDAWVLARTWAEAFRECNTMEDELAFIRCTLNEDLTWFKQSPEFLDSYKNDHAAWKKACSMYSAGAS